jgi:hypothetical protein
VSRNSKPGEIDLAHAVEKAVLPEPKRIGSEGFSFYDLVAGVQILSKASGNSLRL